MRSHMPILLFYWHGLQAGDFAADGIAPSPLVYNLRSRARTFSHAALWSVSLRRSQSAKGECVLRRYNPTDVGRAAKLLQGGGVVGKNLQPFEAHVPFLLQLKIDLNLAGMGWLHLSQVPIMSCHI